MKLLILGDGLDDPTYRGTDRRSPHYVDSLPESHPANQAFLRYVNNEQEEPGSGVIDDLEMARRIVDEYAKLDPPRDFEIIEITRGDELPESGGTLLGYDVTELSCHSIIANHLPFDPHRHRHAIAAGGGHRSLAPLIRLFKEYFSTLLNECFLFPDKAAADFCCECAAALIDLLPDVFDMPKKSLVVVALYLVHAPSEGPRGKGIRPAEQ